MRVFVSFTVEEVVRPPEHGEGREAVSHHIKQAAQEGEAAARRAFADREVQLRLGVVAHVLQRKDVLDTAQQRQRLRQRDTHPATPRAGSGDRNGPHELLCGGPVDAQRVGVVLKSGLVEAEGRGVTRDRWDDAHCQDQLLAVVVVVLLRRLCDRVEDLLAGVRGETATAGRRGGGRVRRGRSGRRRRRVTGRGEFN